MRRQAGTIGGSSAGNLLARMPVSLREALLLFILMRVALSAFALFASFLFPLPGPCFHNGVVDWTSMPELHPDGFGARLLGVWERWDACWYLRIATFGYEAGEPATAFFPVFPTSIRLVAPFLGWDLTIAALVVTGIALLAALACMHALVRLDFDRRTADRSILYLVAFPTAFFLFAPFTESVFLALAVGSIYLTRTGRHGFAIPLALLAGLTRAQGVLLSIPLAWEAFLLVRRNGFAPGHRLPVIKAAAAAGAPIVGFLSFAAFSSVTTGLAPSTSAQQHWGYALRPPWDILGYAWRWMLDPANANFTNIQALTGFHLALIAIFGALLVGGLRILPATYVLYVAPQLALITVGSPTTPLESASRFMLVMFPIFVILGRLGRRRWFHTAWLVSSLLGLGLLFVAILLNVPVG